MTAPPRDGEANRLHRCIRDLAALNALPSMCVGCSPEEALAIVLDALPTALGCELVCLELPATPPRRVGSLLGVPLTRAELDETGGVGYVDGTDATVSCRSRTLWCLQVDVPIGSARGRLVAGRSTPLESDVDRVLFRSAANLVGTTLRTAEVLEAASRKDDFIAMLGHELRNPLASILTAVELLARHSAAVREHHVIERHTRHLARLVDDLLDVSRIARGQIELRRETVSLRSVLDRASELAEPLVKKHQHALAVEAPGSITLHGDAVRLAQIFGNLLSNAAKYTPAGGRIEVVATHLRGRVRVAVKDTGRGLDADQLERVFEPFVQVDRSREALSNGLGLGLAIVRTLVDLHGGAITAESAGPGRGCTFVVELPTTNASAAERPPPSRPSPEPIRTGIRVLIVDDNTDVADLLEEALALAGFITAAVYGPDAALARWRELRPDAAILDVGLPDIDGYELARRLRAEHGPEPLLVAATGYGQERDRVRARQAGFDVHLVKPVGVADLVRLLRERLCDAGARGASSRPTAPTRG